MESRSLGSAVIVVIAALALAGCSKDGDPDSTPALPPIVTTTPPTTTTVIVTTLPPSYEIQQGDTLSAIADSYSTSVQAILDANPEIEGPDDIHAGESIRIPPPDGTDASVPATGPAQNAPGESTVASTSEL